MTTQTLVLRDSQICWIEKMPVNPTMRKYGYQEAKGPENESGWMLEGGEEAYYAALGDYDFKVKAIIESAPQVSNPEVLKLSIDIFGMNLSCNGKTFPDRVPFEVSGWRIEKSVEMSEGWQPTYNNPDNSGCEQPSEPVEIYKLIPEQFGNTEQLKYPDQIQFDTEESFFKACRDLRATPEPLEPSQEELWNEIGKIVFDTTSFKFYNHVLNTLKERFTIQQRKP